MNIPGVATERRYSQPRLRKYATIPTSTTSMKPRMAQKAWIDPSPGTRTFIPHMDAMSVRGSKITETDVSTRVAGRLVARRGQGKAAFLDLQDRSGRIQLLARVNVLGQERFDAFEQKRTRASQG